MRSLYLRGDLIMIDFHKERRIIIPIMRSMALMKKEDNALT